MPTPTRRPSMRKPTTRLPQVAYPAANAAVQHRRRVRLLVSGSAPFDELDRVWDDHFISARQIKLPFLDELTAIGLLTQPDPGFPADAIPTEVAQEVFER